MKLSILMTSSNILYTFFHFLIIEQSLLLKKGRGMFNDKQKTPSANLPEVRLNLKENYYEFL